VLSDSSEALLDSTDGASYATVFLAVLSPGGRRLAYASAGHNPPLLLRADGRAEWLDGGGLPAGIFPGVTLETYEADLGRGDVIVAFTDGLTEAMDPLGEEFGTGRLLAAARGGRGLPASELAGRIVAAVRGFTRAVPHHDDVTLVVVRAVA
jgi:sigma-B regulation protein RsbU (phosphoserine phosphatase)